MADMEGREGETAWVGGGAGNGAAGLLTGPNPSGTRLDLRRAEEGMDAECEFEEPRETATGGLGPTGAGPAGVA